jgi:hypothetical protein
VTDAERWKTTLQALDMLNVKGRTSRRVDDACTVVLVRAVRIYSTSVISDARLAIAIATDDAHKAIGDSVW